MSTTLSNHAAPAQLTTVTQIAYDLAADLHAAGANGHPVPVEREWAARKFDELVKKGVLHRTGQTPGRFGKPGAVTMLVPLSSLTPIPNRAARVPRAPGTRRRSRTSRPAAPAPTGARPRLSILALEAFVVDYKTLEAPLREQRTQAVQDRIAGLQVHLGSSTGDDFRNTLAMANAAIRELDEIESAVAAEVLRALDPGDIESPLYIVWKAMQTG